MTLIPSEIIARCQDLNQRINVKSQSGDVQSDESNMHNKFIQEITVLESQLHQVRSQMAAYDVKMCLDILTSLKRQLDSYSQVARPRFKFKSKSRQREADQTFLDKDSANSAQQICDKAYDQASHDNQEHLAVSEQCLSIRDVHYRHQLPESLLSLIVNANFQTISVKNCSFAVIDLQSLKYQPKSLRISNVKSCLVIAPPVDGPVFVDGVSESLIICHCKQLRVHNSSGVKFIGFSSSSPVIENCTQLTFADSRDFYNHYEDQIQQVEGSSVQYNDGSQIVGPINKFYQVQDFGWLQAGQSPNYNVDNSVSDVTSHILEQIKIYSDNIRQQQQQEQKCDIGRG
ncbi:hypothetical protein MIR68_005252 [Amoeboaphelidium protococcarum]|nr:hypothetical protein MIR68_005252 [Amoeboaphelidium protococcarum]